MLGNSLQGIGGAIITSPSPGTVPDDVRRCLRKSALMRSCDSRRMSIGAIGPRLFCRSCRSHARLTASSVNPSRCIASKTPSNRDSSAEPSGPKRDASDDSVTLSPACSRASWPSTRNRSRSSIAFRWAWTACNRASRVSGSPVLAVVLDHAVSTDFTNSGYAMTRNSGPATLPPAG
jgi:hypothetical protein